MNRCWQPPAGHVDGLLQLPSISRQLKSRCFCGVGHGRDDDQLAITFRRLDRRALRTEVDGDGLAVESNCDCASHPRHFDLIARVDDLHLVFRQSHAVHNLTRFSLLKTTEPRNGVRLGRPLGIITCMVSILSGHRERGRRSKLFPQMSPHPKLSAIEFSIIRGLICRVFRIVDWVFSIRKEAKFLKNLASV